ncbi:MAG: hypothetical protein ABGX00_04680 [Allomuricauda sp.]
MLRIIYLCLFVLLFQCNGIYVQANVINVEPIGFSVSGDFLAIYSYTSLDESSEWRGQLAILDVKNNSIIDLLDLVQEYAVLEVEKNISNRSIVIDLLNRLYAKDNFFLIKYGIEKGNLGFLSYYRPTYTFLEENNDCTLNNEIKQSLSIPICSQRFYNPSLFGARQFILNMETTVMDESKEDYDSLGCSECFKNFRIKILDKESNKLLFDFENQLKPGDCYRDYFVGSVYFYGSSKIVIIAYGLRPGFEGLMLQPIFLSLTMPNEY